MLIADEASIAFLVSQVRKQRKDDREAQKRHCKSSSEIGSDDSGSMKVLL